MAVVIDAPISALPSGGNLQPTDVLAGLPAAGTPTSKFSGTEIIEGVKANINIGNSVVPFTDGSGALTASPSDISYNGVTFGIGSISPEASAIVQSDITTQGWLPPRLTNAQMNAIASPATGLFIYNTDDGKIYNRQGGAWRSSYEAPFGSLFLSAAGTTVFSGIGVFTEFIGPVTTNFNSNFAIFGNRLRYLGSLPRTVMVTAVLSANTAGAAVQVIAGRISLFASSLASSEQQMSLLAALDPECMTMRDIITLNNGDEISVQVANNTTLDSLIIEKLHLTISSLT
ncbi:MAG: hypothetical protein ACPGVV_01900 [Croceimicrobium sp.]